jgi:glycosyltransferase involved in cell wall biosynthesis
VHPGEVEKNSHRIVLVSGGIKLGGAATFLLNLGGELVRREIPVQVVSLEHENPFASDFALARIPLHVEDERKAIFEDRIASALQVIRHFKPTVVVACLGPSSYEILRYIPKSVTRLGMLQSDSPDSYPVVATYAPFFDGVIGVSRKIQDNFRADPVLGRVPTHYLPYGVPLPKENLRPAREQSEPIRILYFGRLCRPQKRVHLFAEIFRQLKAARLPFQWTIAGDGPERLWLEKEMISSSPMSVVQFPGAIDYRGVPRLLDSHDVFLLTSDHEGLPLSLLEAMGHGVVPIVSDLESGIREVVDATNGVLVPVDDLDGYVRAIAYFDKHRDELAAKSTAAAERVRVEFSVEAMADRWLKVLGKGADGTVVWPYRFDVRGPLTDSKQWKYSAAARPLRRLLKLIFV